MDTTILLAIIGIAEAVITGFVTFFMTKRKYNTEVDSNIIKNMQESLTFYKELSDDNKARLVEAQQKAKAMEQEISELRSVVFGMLTQICTDMMCQNRSFDKQRCPYYSSIPSQAIPKAPNRKKQPNKHKQEEHTEE